MDVDARLDRFKYRAFVDCVRPAIVCVLCGLALGCSNPSTESRAGWLQATLVHDNYSVALRSPDLVAGKFRKMASGPYAYFRGTLPQFTRDLLENTARYPSSFVTAESIYISLIGDPHYENIGTYALASGEVTLDFNDFDAATTGPFHFDVRRLALSVYVAMAQLDAWSAADAERQGLGASAASTEAQRVELASIVASAYADQIQRLMDGGQSLRIRAQSGYGLIVDDIMRRALRDGESQEVLAEYTQVLADGRRTFIYGDFEPEVDGVISDRLAPPAPEISTWLVSAWPGLVNTLLSAEGYSTDYFHIKDVAQRFGAGVSSYALLRFYVLIEGASESPDDDLVLEVKEASDPAQYPGLDYVLYPRFGSNAERSVYFQRRLQETPANDRHLGWLDGAGSSSGDYRLAELSRFSARVRHRTKFQKGLAVTRLFEKLGEGSWSVGDLQEMVALAGRLLASRHASALPPDGTGSPLMALHEVLAGRQEEFRAEVADFVSEYGPILLADFERFGRLLAVAGPLLGQRLPAGIADRHRQ